MAKKKINKTQKVLYFAYGSNMHQPRLEKRVGKVTNLGAYTLRGYKLTFDTGSRFCAFANVKQDKDETCEGVVYEMTYGQLLILDWYEGLYERIKETYNGRKLHIYISEHARNKFEPQVTIDYHQLIVKGAMVHNLQKTLAIMNAIKPVPEPPVRITNPWWEERWD